MQIQDHLSDTVLPFKLDLTNSLSLQELRMLIAPDLDDYLRLIQDSDKSHNDEQLTDILDSAEKFHLVLCKMNGRSVDPFGCSCMTCYKHVRCAR